MTLFYNNSILSEDDYPELSERFKIPYDLVAEVVAQMEEDGEPRWASYTGTIRERIRQMSEHISDKPQPTDSAPLPLAENDDVVNRAAIALMQAMSSNEAGSFIITDDGICTINPKSPPSLTDSYEVVHKVMKLRELAPKMDDKTSWMLGSIVWELEQFHGEDFEISQVVEQTEKAYNTVWTARKVYEAFRKRRFNLSFTHHKEAFFKKIPEESKALVLHKCELYDLSSKHVRALCSIIKQDGDDSKVKAIRSANQANQLIKDNKKETVLYIVLDNGVLSRVRGTAEAIPTGKLVIDTKNWTARANNGQPVEVPFKK